MCVYFSLQQIECQKIEYLISIIDNDLDSELPESTVTWDIISGCPTVYPKEGGVVPDSFLSRSQILRDLIGIKLKFIKYTQVTSRLSG